MYTSELDGNVTLGLRAFDGSNYQVRCTIAKYLAILLATFQSLPSDRISSISVTSTHQVKMEKMLNYLAKGFLILKPTIANQAQNEVRIGISYVRHTRNDFVGNIIDCLDLSCIDSCPWYNMGRTTFISLD